MTIFLSDVHGEFTYLKAFLNQMKNYEVIQLGDLGIGFPKELSHTWPPSKKIYALDELTNLENLPNFKFISGNHDHPELCKQHPNYLGDYGIYKTKDGFDLFFISGSPSIPQDINREYPGVTWWQNEELSIDEWDKCLELYSQTKPEIVISHCCPQRCVFILHKEPFNKIGGLSERRMNEMMDIHKPKTWIFGHHHIDRIFTYDKINFIAIGAMSYRIYDHENDKS